MENEIEYMPKKTALIVLAMLCVSILILYNIVEGLRWHIHMVDQNTIHLQKELLAKEKENGR